MEQKMLSCREDYENGLRKRIDWSMTYDKDGDDQNNLFENSSQSQNMTQISNNEPSEIQLVRQKVDPPKQQKSSKKVNDKDYRKNICTNINKKLTKEFTNDKFKRIVDKFCKAQNVSYEKTVAFYQTKIPTISGPTYLDALLVPQNEEQIPMKKAFLTFFQWFLRERYLRYLMLEGKMEKPEAYIEYKNYTLLYLLKVEEEYFE